MLPFSSGIFGNLFGGGDQVSQAWDMSAESRLQDHQSALAEIRAYVDGGSALLENSTYFPKLEAQETADYNLDKARTAYHNLPAMVVRAVGDAILRDIPQIEGDEKLAKDLNEKLEEIGFWTDHFPQIVQNTLTDGTFPLLTYWDMEAEEIALGKRDSYYMAIQSDPDDCEKITGIAFVDVPVYGSGSGSIQTYTEVYSAEKYARIKDSTEERNQANPYGIRPLQLFCLTPSSTIGDHYGQSILKDVIPLMTLHVDASRALGANIRTHGSPVLVAEADGPGFENIALSPTRALIGFKSANYITPDPLVNEHLAVLSQLVEMVSEATGVPVDLLLSSPAERSGVAFEMSMARFALTIEGHNRRLARQLTQLLKKMLLIETAHRKNKTFSPAEAKAFMKAAPINVTASFTPLELTQTKLNRDLALLDAGLVDAESVIKRWNEGSDPDTIKEILDKYEARQSAQQYQSLQQPQTQTGFEFFTTEEGE